MAIHIGRLLLSFSRSRSNGSTFERLMMLRWPLMSFSKRLIDGCNVIVALREVNSYNFYGFTQQVLHEWRIRGTTESVHSLRTAHNNNGCLKAGKQASRPIVITCPILKSSSSMILIFTCLFRVLVSLKWADLKLGFNSRLSKRCFHFDSLAARNKR